MMKFRALTLLVRQQKGLLTFKNQSINLKGSLSRVWHNQE